ncbi:hypothetical protein SCUP234_05696 [Seiridium cupressi]
MKVLLTILAVFTVVVLGLQGGYGGGTAVKNNTSMPPTLHEVMAMLAQIVKREEGPSAFVPNVSTALFPALGIDDTYLIDCKEEFTKSFVCCSKLDSEDQSCIDQCTCREISQANGKNVANPHPDTPDAYGVVRGTKMAKTDHSPEDSSITTNNNASPTDPDGLEVVTVIGTVQLELLEKPAQTAKSGPSAGNSNGIFDNDDISKRSSGDDIRDSSFYCGSFDFTEECSVLGTECSEEGIVSSSEACRKLCYCRIWDNSDPPIKDIDSRKRRSGTQNGHLSCDSKNMEYECVAQGAACTPGGVMEFTRPQYVQPGLISQALKAFSIVSIATGSADVLFGIRMIATKPGESAPKPATVSLMDSQLRFLGAMWAGYGMILWWASNNLVSRRVPLAVLGGVMFLGGLGRAASGLSHGMAATWVKVATAVELVGPGLVYLLAFAGK